MNVQSLRLLKSSLFSLLFAVIIFAGAACLLPPVSKFEDSSDDLITESLKHEEAGAFMIRRDERVSPEWKPYHSQLGLTYQLLRPFQRQLNSPALPFTLSLAYAVMTAATFWLFSRHLCATRGPLEAWTFLILCCFTPTFLMFSGSFYWQLPLLVAPFLITFVLGVDRLAPACGLVFIVLLLRFLGGYEYTSTLLLSPVCAMFLRFAFGDIEMTPAIRRSMALGAVGFLAFLLAVGIHLWAMRLSEGSWPAAVAAFRSVATYRTSGDYLAREISLRSDLIQLIASFFRNEVIFLIGLGLATCLLWAVSRGPQAAGRLAAAFGFALLAGVSWQVLARGHMRDHAHINFIVYCLPFGLSVHLAFSRLAALLGNREKQDPDTIPHRTIVKR